MGRSSGCPGLVVVVSHSLCSWKFLQSRVEGSLRLILCSRTDLTCHHLVEAVKVTNKPVEVWTGWALCWEAYEMECLPGVLTPHVDQLHGSRLRSSDGMIGQRC